MIGGLSYATWILVFVGAVALLVAGVFLLIGLFQARSLVRREFNAYFLSPIAYVILFFFLVVTGFLFWQPWFTPYFSIPVGRIAVLLHAIAAVVMVLAVIVHVYAAIWVKGTVRAMTRGTVTEGWARQNHPLWHREMTKGR